ncbi:PEP-CTERM sorting domain-containing protein [Duganella vulcania]|uniref:PEP-CTERM sorting domain-containing protein n=1 Tax=Duganella vulcania TaxID=2692166 RepID=UPI0020C24467|nr:PEP-CTERM sorting domain-containing protein [Duganella vulcania]
MMTMQTYLKTVAATAVGLALAMPMAFTAAATVSAGASVTNVQFKVVDLTPDDGQTGGIIYDRRFQTLGAIVGDSRKQVGSTDWSALSVFNSSGTNYASKTHSGVPGEVQAYAQNSGGDDGSSTYGEQGGDFLLLPHTSISMWGHMAGFVQSVGGPGQASVTAQSSVVFYDYISFAQLDSDSQRVDLTRSPYGASYDKDFRLSFENDTDAIRFITWGSGADAYAATTAPVPEPEGYAMLAAGLLLIGVAARRRKAAQS